MKTPLLLFVAVRFLICCVHWMAFSHLPVVLKDYGLTDPGIGAVIGLYSLSSMALMLPMGLFSDFFSPRRTIIGGAVLFCCYFISLLAVRSFWQLLPAALVGGLGTACLMVVSESLYLKLFGQEKRGQRVAFFQLSTYLGYGLGPLAGGVLVSHSPLLLFQTAAIGAALVLALGMLLPDSEPILFSFRAYRDDLRQPKPLFLIACIFAIGTHFGVEQTSFSLLMKEELGFSARTIGALFAGLGLWMAAIVPFIGRLHDRREDVFLFFLGGLLVSSLFQILTAWAAGFWSLFALRILHTTGDAVALLELGVLTALFFPSHRLGGNSGLLYGVRTMATFVAALLSGTVNRHWGYAESFLLNGIFVFLFVAASILFIRTSAARMRSVGWGEGSARRGARKKRENELS